MKTALVIGAGAFGTSIASVLSNNFDRVILKVRSEDIYRNLKEKKENTVYLPGLNIHEKIVPALSWDEVDALADKKVDLLVSGLPSSAITGYLFEHFDKVLSYLKNGIPVVSLAKGIDPITLELCDDLFLNYFPEYMDSFTFLSGPSFAREIMKRQITLVSLAGRNKKTLEKVVAMLDTPYFKALPGYDIKGTLLGGALKNILAIAGGIIEGLGYNHNTRAAMITRGIAEMLRFGVVYNARPETFYGLSGMGDLILTTTGELSRNKSFGLEIAKGRTIEDILTTQRYVVEGYKTSQAVYRLSERYDIRARIFNGVYSVLYENHAPKEVIARIMSTPSKFEFS